MIVRTMVLRLCTGTAAAAVALGTAPTLPAHGADLPSHVVFRGDISATMDYIGGGGAFAFTSNLCAWADSDDLTTAGLPCTTSASGTFVNTICGTDSMQGTAVISFDPSDGGLDQFDFAIQLIGGIGILIGNGGQAAGVVLELPNNPQPPPGVCTLGFTLMADVTIA